MPVKSLFGFLAAATLSFALMAQPARAAGQFHSPDNLATSIQPQATPVLFALGVSCPTSLTIGQTGQCTANAVYSDSSTQPITPTWSSDNPGALAIDSAGNLTVGQVSAATTVYLTASYSDNGNAMSQSVVVVVGPSPLPSTFNVVCPATISAQQTNSCNGAVGYTDGSSHGVTGIGWVSSDPNILTIDASGNLTAQQVSAPRDVTITATYVESSVRLAAGTVVRVTPAPRTSSVVITCPSSISAGQMQPCTATFVYSDGSGSQVFTPTWSSSDPGLLAIDASGNLTAQQVSTPTDVTITGTYFQGGVLQSATAVVQVTPPTPSNWVIVSCPGSLVSGQVGQCVAVREYSDGSNNQAVTPIWSSSNPASLTIDSNGNLSALQVASTTAVTITATYSDNGVVKKTQISITVTPSGVVQPANIVVGSVTSTYVSAIITPSPPDVGSTAKVWMGAIYNGTLYLRNGTSWLPYTGGAYPMAIQAQSLTAKTLVNVAEGVDVSHLPGLQIYVGFGSNQQDMLTTPGKLALIYTVPTP